MNQQLLRIHEFGPYRIDAATRLVLRHGEVVPLTPKCFEILIALHLIKRLIESPQ